MNINQTNPKRSDRGGAWCIRMTFVKILCKLEIRVVNLLLSYIWHINQEYFIFLYFSPYKAR